MKFFLSYLLIYFSLPALAFQADEQHLLQVRTISIAPYGNDNGLIFEGIYYDLSNMLAKESGYQVNHYIYPYARIIQELKSGQTDLSILFKYEELEDYVHYLLPLPPLKNVVIGRKGSTINSIKQLKGKRLAYLRGASFNDEIDDDDEIYKQSITNFTQGVKCYRLAELMRLSVL
jgi:polar amino acid transport system substrate-binding protein